MTSVQSALKTRGYYDGSVDGVFGPQSQQALSAFQHANHLSETGLLDAPSLTALGVGVKSGKSKAPAAKPAPARRAPTGEGTFVPPPIGEPAAPPSIPAEATTPAAEPPVATPPPIATPAPAPPAHNNPAPPSAAAGRFLRSAHESRAPVVDAIAHRDGLMTIDAIGDGDLLGV